MRTKIAFFAMLLYSGTFSRCTQNSVYGVYLNNALCRNLIEDQLNLRFH